MKPIYKWSGGKRDEIEKFKSFYPKNYSLYIEPFFGAGAVYFDLEGKTSAVINDIHQESVIFLKAMKDGHAEEIYGLMKQFPNDEKTYYFVRDKFEKDTDVKKAFWFFYLRKTCYRGMLRYNQKGKFNIPFGRYKTYNFEELLKPEYTKIFQNTEIYNKDYKEIFEKYNDENNFVFLDPPYDSEFTDYGYCKFDRQNQKELAEIFKTTKNKCLMIIAATPFILDLYKDYIKGSYSKKYAFKLYDGRVGDEINKEHLIITNY